MPQVMERARGSGPTLPMDSFVSSSAFDPFASWRGLTISCDERVPVALPTGMLPPLIDLRKKRDVAVLSRSAKYRVSDRIDALPMWAGAKQVLHLLAKRAAGRRHRVVLSHGHIAELLHRSGKIRGTSGTLYTVQYIRVCLRLLGQEGLVRWTRLLPGDRFPSRDLERDGEGEIVEAGCCVFEVNLAALLGAGPTWPPRPKAPGFGGRPRRSSPHEDACDAQEVAEARAQFQALQAGAADQAPPVTPEALPGACACPVEGASPLDGVIIHDLDGVIIHDHCSLPASQDLKIDPERHDAAGPQRPQAARDVGAARPLESFCSANEPSPAPEPASACPRGLTAADDVGAPRPAPVAPPSATLDREPDAPQNAPNEGEHGSRQRSGEPDAPAGVRSDGRGRVPSGGHTTLGGTVTGPDGVEHAMADLLRTMPPWFQALAAEHRRQRQRPQPDPRRKREPPAPDLGPPVAHAWKPRDPNGGAS
jgi:hypothetical protein